MKAGSLAIAVFLGLAELTAQQVAGNRNDSFSRFHLNVGYGRTRFNARTDVKNAYRSSGYPYIVISTADASPRVRLPIALTLGGEYSILKSLRVGANYSRYGRHSIRGSNWIGGDWQSAPIERFDIEEITSGSAVTTYMDYVFIPVRHGESRWEASVGAGLAFSKQKMSGIQTFSYYPSFSNRLLDSSGTYKKSASAWGIAIHSALDFYWSRWISTQVRLDFKLMPSMHVKEQALTYGTLYKPNFASPYQYVLRTKTVEGHPISFSGSILSLWIRFHF